MRDVKKVTSIASSLGSLQSMRRRVPESPDTQISTSPSGGAPEFANTRRTASLNTRVPKRADPDLVQLKAYVRPETKRDAWRKYQDEGGEQISDLVQKLLDEYLGR